MKQNFSTNNEIILPLYSESFYPHEWEILNSDARFTVICAHRKSRKTTTVLNKVLLEATIKADGPGMYYIVFPTATMARDIIWRDPTQLWRVIPRQLIRKVNETEMNIELINRCVIAIRGSDDIDRLTGTSGKFYALDEDSIMKPEVWEQVVQPVLHSNGGKAIICGTPRGKNHFYRLFLRGQDPTYPDWQSFYYPVDKTQALSQQEIDTLRNEMDKRLFSQEYGCDWLDSSGVVFRGVRDVAILDPQGALNGHTYVCGVDLARLQDFTAITVFDRSNNRMVYLERIKDLDWTVQSQKIKEIAERYNHALCVVEANNMGDVIIDTLARLNVAVQPYKTTAPSKKEMVEKLSLYIESRKIWLLNDPVLINELETFGYEVTAMGNVKYGATTAHDDLVISTALAVTSLFPIMPTSRSEKPRTLLQRMFERDLRESDPDFMLNRQLNEWASEYE